MGMTVHNYSGYRDMGSGSLAAARPAARRPPGPWRQYPSSPEGWGVESQKSFVCEDFAENWLL